jgi:hypothetical protein
MRSSRPLVAPLAEKSSAGRNVSFGTGHLVGSKLQTCLATGCASLCFYLMSDGMPGRQESPFSSRPFRTYQVRQRPLVAGARRFLGIKSSREDRPRNPSCPTPLPYCVKWHRRSRHGKRFGWEKLNRKQTKTDNKVAARAAEEATAGEAKAAADATKSAQPRVPTQAERKAARKPKYLKRQYGLGRQDFGWEQVQQLTAEPGRARETA